jgi:hypothetical protein
MVLIQQIDKKRFVQKPTIYKGGSLLPFKPLNNKQIYLAKQGGLINAPSILETITDDIPAAVKDIVVDHKDANVNAANKVKEVKQKSKRR